jgi:hypothetical protein
MVSPGLPPLHSSLRAHFLAVSSSFASSNQSTVGDTTSPAVGTLQTVVQPTTQKSKATVTTTVSVPSAPARAAQPAPTSLSISTGSKTPSAPASTLTVSHPNSAGASPISSAVGFLLEHDDFHSFMLAMHSSFSYALKDRPDFPLSQLSDPVFAATTYSITSVRLQKWVSGAWVVMHVFTPEELACIPPLTNKPLYFRLV